MNYKFIDCPNCGYTLEIPENMDEITCCECEISFYPDVEVKEANNEL